MTEEVKAAESSEVKPEEQTPEAKQVVQEVHVVLYDDGSLEVNTEPAQHQLWVLGLLDFVSNRLRQ